MFDDQPAEGLGIVL